MHAEKNIDKNIHLYAALIIIIGTMARAWFIFSGQLDLVQDEAQYWDWTRHLQLTYYSKGPLIAWIIKTGTALAGSTEAGVRLGSLVGAFLFQCLAYCGLAFAWKRPKLGAWTVFVINTCPLFMALGILMTTDNSFVLCWTGAFFSLYLASGSSDERGGKALNWPFVTMALFFAVGILAKYTMLGYSGLAVIYSFILWRKKMLPKGYWPRLIIALAVGVGLGFLPTLIWNMQNDFVGYKHVFYLIGVEGKAAKTLLTLKRFPDYFGSQVGFVTPWWFVFMLLGGWAAIKQCLGKAHRNLGLSYKQALLLSVFFWPMWLFFMAWSFHTKVMPNWSTVSYVAGAVLTAAYFEDFWANGSSGWARYKKVWAGLAVAVFLVLHLVNLFPVPDNLNPTHRLKGWTDLGNKVEQVRLSDFKDPDKVFIFSEQYDMTAALAFYVPGRPRTYCAWVDRRMNQYDMWPGPQDKVGWDAIYVLKKFKKRIDPHIREMFKKIVGPIHYQTKHQGKDARKFTLFLCYDYNGYWPAERGSF